jgi:hypothetical protein
MAWWTALIGMAGSMMSSSGGKGGDRSGALSGGVKGGTAGALVGGMLGAERSIAQRKAREEVAMKNAYAPFYGQGMTTLGPKDDPFTKGLIMGAISGWKGGSNIGSMFAEKQGEDGMRAAPQSSPPLKYGLYYDQSQYRPIPERQGDPVQYGYSGFQPEVTEQPQTNFYSG